LQSKPLQYLFWVFIFLVTGCGTYSIQSHKNTPDFFLSPHTSITLHVNQFSNDIKKVLQRKGFLIETHRPLNIVIESSLDKHSCALKPLVSYENYIRITLYKEDVEYYRIQLNQQSSLELDDFKMLIQKMCEELKEGNSK